MLIPAASSRRVLAARASVREHGTNNAPQRRTGSSRRGTSASSGRGPRTWRHRSSPVVASTATTSPVGALPMKASSTASHEVPVGATGRAGVDAGVAIGAPSSRRNATRARPVFWRTATADGARRDERRALDRARRVRVRDGPRPADVAPNTGRPSRDVRPRAPRRRRRTWRRERPSGGVAKAEPIAQAPDHRAGHDVERGERAVAAREVDEPCPPASCAACRAPARVSRPRTSASAARRSSDRRRPGGARLR